MANPIDEMNLGGSGISELVSMLKGLRTEINSVAYEANASITGFHAEEQRILDEIKKKREEISKLGDTDANKQKRYQREILELEQKARQLAEQESQKQIKAFQDQMLAKRDITSKDLEDAKKISQLYGSMTEGQESVRLLQQQRAQNEMS